MICEYPFSKNANRWQWALPTKGKFLQKGIKLAQDKVNSSVGYSALMTNELTPFPSIYSGKVNQIFKCSHKPS